MLMVVGQTWHELSCMVTVDDLLAVPVAIARAIRTLDRHPQVIGIAIASRADDESPVDVTLQIKSELPSRFRGESPSGVRRVEARQTIISCLLPSVCTAPEFTGRL